MCCSQHVTTLTMDHTPSPMEETPGPVSEQWVRTGPDRMCLDKQNQGGLNLKNNTAEETVGRRTHRSCGHNISSSRRNSKVFSFHFSWELYLTDTVLYFFFCRRGDSTVVFSQVFSMVAYIYNAQYIHHPSPFPLFLCLLSYGTQSSFQRVNRIFVQAWQAGDLTLANHCRTCLCFWILHSERAASQTGPSPSTSIFTQASTLAHLNLSLSHCPNPSSIWIFGFKIYLTFWASAQFHFPLEIQRWEAIYIYIYPQSVMHIFLICWF